MEIDKKELRAQIAVGSATPKFLWHIIKNVDSDEDIIKLAINQLKPFVSEIAGLRRVVEQKENELLN